MKTAIKPLADRVLIKRDETEAVSAGGIVLAGTEVEKPVLGEVLAIGNDVTAVSVGNKVIFAKMAGEDVTVDGDTNLMLLEEHIIAIVRE